MRILRRIGSPVTCFGKGWRYSIYPTLFFTRIPSMPTHAARRIATALAFLYFMSTAGAQNIDFASINIQTVKVADGLYVLMGGPAQGNIAVSVGSDGIFLVD